MGLDTPRVIYGEKQLERLDGQRAVAYVKIRAFRRYLTSWKEKCYFLFLTFVTFRSILHDV